MAAAQIFKALGDPIRLEMVTRLADGSTQTLGNLSKGLGVTRQGARKQIEVLVSAKVVHLKPLGREIMVTLDTSTLEIARAFIAKLESQWDSRLKALKDFVEHQ